MNLPTLWAPTVQSSLSCIILEPTTQGSWAGCDVFPQVLAVFPPYFCQLCAFLHILLSFSTFYAYPSSSSTSLNFSQSILKFSLLGMPVCHHSPATPIVVIVRSRSFSRASIRNLHSLFTFVVASNRVLNRPIPLRGCGDKRVLMVFGQLDIDQAISQDPSIFVPRYFHHK